MPSLVVSAAAAAPEAAAACFARKPAEAAAAAAATTAAAATASVISASGAAAAAEHCSSRVAAAALLQQFDVFVFDCDGVLWHGSKLLPGIREMLQQLQQTPRTCSTSTSNSNTCKSVYFLTNNSTLSRKGFVAKLNKLGIDATEHQVLCTSYATARFILSQQQQQKQQQQQQRSCNGSITQQQQQQRVYVVGEQGLLDELRNNGIDAFGGPEESYEAIDFSTDPGICVNPDKWAGAGTMVAAVAAATQQQPVLMGKPSEEMKRLVLDTLGESLDRVLLVGDSLQTDIAFAAAAALKSCLCLTGVTDGVLLRSAFAAAKLDSSTNTSNNSSNGREQQQPKAVLPDFIIDTAANLCPKPHSS
ncbi:pyridoxal phosphate phosphatase, putative [Eimeria maxima]|uniref:Pyridoxal phosphate phosphatase, putative n=1 Tax=Eimeria maxima TaxID=5804 RepID=U6LZH8_EIMMA|nr:pyridoxal phosphate phosphatase, putative [Eimeria maxima]CDJ57151.1 pyridoxal phosphate phosphatase, putative [Eimeria maxima]